MLTMTHALPERSLPSAMPEPRSPRRLAPAAERELVLAAMAREPRAREQLVHVFLPLIASVARIYRGSPAVDREELMQEGVVGLLRALERFDPEMGTPFWAYATWWVRQAMQSLVSELARPVVLSDRAVRKLARVKDARREHMSAHSREPTSGELAAETGIDPLQVDSLLVAERRARGLEEPLSGDRTAGETFGEMLADPKAEDAYDRVPRRVVGEHLPAMLRALDDRERTIVRARFGLDGRERTLRELAGTLGVSAERVRQIEQRALGKLLDAAY
jgi:RNA polymerase primary sigma factor